MSDWSGYAPRAAGDLPSSPSAQRNLEPILSELAPLVGPDCHILEVASGTGEHAIAACSKWPDIVWQPSDLDLDAMGLVERFELTAPPNVLTPIHLDVADWPDELIGFDMVLSINCIHIAPENLLPAYVEGCAGSLRPGGVMVLYGPFRYGGDFDVASNAEFDAFLKRTYPGGGIRDFETADALAGANGLTLEQDTAMPANNRFIVWRKA